MLSLAIELERQPNCNGIFPVDWCLFIDLLANYELVYSLKYRLTNGA
ncbi:hypothetical protein Z949_2715 [Sulfitobacter guttiformis KCTC 32187]|nr:hypothetical protein Z949_2715 [Sulfitobacter guttiformis KCTC 32187]